MTLHYYYQHPESFSFPKFNSALRIRLITSVECRYVKWVSPFTQAMRFGNINIYVLKVNLNSISWQGFNSTLPDANVLSRDIQ